MKSTASYGNCYVFNSVWNPSDSQAGRRTSALTGPAYGLQLVLNLDQKNYMNGGQSKQAGARLVISTSNTLALQDEKGMDLSPNTLTQVAIQETNVTRQPFPYTSKCFGDWNDTYYADDLEGMGTGIPPYSIAVCMNAIDAKCVIKNVLSKVSLSAMPKNLYFA